MNDKEIVQIYEEALRQIVRNGNNAQSCAANALQKVEMIKQMIIEKSFERDWNVP